MTFCACETNSCNVNETKDCKSHNSVWYLMLSVQNQPTSKQESTSVDIHCSSRAEHIQKLILPLQIFQSSFPQLICCDSIATLGMKSANVRFGGSFFTSIYYLRSVLKHTCRSKQSNKSDKAKNVFTIMLRLYSK